MPSPPSSTPAAPPQRPLYPAGVPSKFSPEGLLQPFPGNTILCHLPLDTPLIRALHSVHSTITSHPVLSPLMHALPPSSWHMTVLDLAHEDEHQPGTGAIAAWPLPLPPPPPGTETPRINTPSPPLLATSLSESTRAFAEILQPVGRQLAEEGLGPPYRMRVRGFDPAVVGIGLDVEGADAEEEERLRRLRDRLADGVGFRAPDHGTYGFHITMAYLLRHVDGEEREELNRVFGGLLPDVRIEFELGRAEFCTFEDMHAFRSMFYLGGKGEERS